MLILDFDFRAQNFIADALREKFIQYRIAATWSSLHLKINFVMVSVVLKEVILVKYTKVAILEKEAGLKLLLFKMTIWSRYMEFAKRVNIFTI